jgi:hypothetical protein
LPLLLSLVLQSLEPYKLPSRTTDRHTAAMTVCIRAMGVLLLLGLLLLHTSAAAQDSGQAIVTVALVAPADASAEQATQLLFGSTPGLLKIIIPGSSSTLDLTATGVDATTGAIIFESAGASAELIEALTAQLADGIASGSLTAGLTVSGFLNGQGVQLVILDVTPGADGTGSLQATITFD